MFLPTTLDVTFMQEKMPGRYIYGLHLVATLSDVELHHRYHNKVT